MKEAIASMIMVCGLHVLPQPSAAVDLHCPQSFATQSLGIQNIIVAQKKTYVADSIMQYTDSKNAGASNEVICRNLSAGTELGINGLIFLPSPTVSRSGSLVEIPKDYSMVITVSSADDKSRMIAGAKVPLSQIEGFPISFTLGKDNLVTDDGQDFVEKSDSDIFVTVKVCPSSDDLPCMNSDALFQGIGISKMLLLPAGDDTDMKVRAATSIRLSKSSVPDILTSW
jgi:hypothetical protein